MLKDLNLGELLQHEFKNLDIREIEDNFDLCCFKTYCKTGTLFSNSAKGLGDIFDLDDKQKNILFNIGSIFGLIFQFMDDYLDIIKNNEKVLDKECFKDIRDGIFTFNFQVFISNLFFHDEKKSEKFLELYSKKNKTEEDIDYIVNQMNNKEIMDFNKYYIFHLQNLCLNYVKELEQSFNNNDSDLSQSVFFLEFYNLLDYIIRRRK